MTKIGTALDVEPNGQEPSCHLRRLRQRQSRERKSLPNSSLTETAQGACFIFNIQTYYQISNNRSSFFTYLLSIFLVLIQIL